MWPILNTVSSQNACLVLKKSSALRGNCDSVEQHIDCHQVRAGINTTDYSEAVTDVMLAACSAYLNCFEHRWADQTNGVWQQCGNPNYGAIILPTIFMPLILFFAAATLGLRMKLDRTPNFGKCKALVMLVIQFLLPIAAILHAAGNFCYLMFQVARAMFDACCNIANPVEFP